MLVLGFESHSVCSLFGLSEVQCRRDLRRHEMRYNENAVARRACIVLSDTHDRVSPDQTPMVRARVSPHI